MNAAAEDHWTEVLAGRAAPQDADARRAARARAWFEAQARADLAAPADEAAIGHLLVRLEAAAASARPVTAAAPRAGTPYDGVFDHSAEGGHAALAVPAARPPSFASAGWAWLRVGFLAWFAPRPLTVFAAALFAGVLILQWHAVPEDDSQVKTAVPAAGAPAPDGRGHTLIARSAAPLQDAIALRDELQALGLAAQVLELGSATRVQANVDAGLQTTVQQKLNQRGWVWTPGPQLSVEFQRAP